MGQWKSIGLNELGDIIKNNYPNQELTVGIDRENMIYYVVPASLGLDASIELVRESLKSADVRDSIGSEGFPRDLYVWVEEENDEGEGGLLDDEDLKELENTPDSPADVVIEPGTDGDSGSDDDIEYLMAELNKLRSENRDLETALSEKEKALAEKAGSVGEGKEITIEAGGKDSQFIEEELVARENAAELAQTTLKEFDKLVNSGDISPFGEGQFRKSDLLQFALGLYEEGTVPKKKYELDLEAAQDELPEGHGEGKCIPVSEAGADSTYTQYFTDDLYDKGFAEKALDSLAQLGIAPEGFSIESLTPVDTGQYRIPSALADLVEKYDEISKLIHKAQELEKRISEQTEKAEDLDRKITGYREEEEKITEEITREKEDLKELDSILKDIEKSGLGKLSETLSNLFKKKKGT